MQYSSYLQDSTIFISSEVPMNCHLLAEHKTAASVLSCLKYQIVFIQTFVLSPKYKEGSSLWLSWINIYFCCMHLPLTSYYFDYVVCRYHRPPGLNTSNGLDISVVSTTSLRIISSTLLFVSCHSSWTARALLIKVCWKVSFHVL